MTGAMGDLPTEGVLNVDFGKEEESARIDDSRPRKQVAGLRTGRTKQIDVECHGFDIPTGRNRGHGYPSQSRLDEARKVERTPG
jgi:hypothetical protein